MKLSTKSLIMVAAFVAISTSTFAQATAQPYRLTFQSDFCSGGIWSSTGTFTIVDNPEVSDVNRSSKCGTFDIPVSAPDWALAWFNISELLPTGTSFIMDVATSTVTLNVRSTVISEWILKLEAADAVDGASPDNLEAKATNVGTGAWETLTFRFTPNGKEHSKVIILPVYTMPSGSRTQPITVFFDNLDFDSGYMCSCTSLSTTKATDISLSPNPTTGLLNISSSQELNQVVICNMLGQTVKITEVSGFDSSVDVSDLLAGTYVAKIKLANGIIATQKVVKI